MTSFAPPSDGQPNRSWEARPGAARAIRAIVLLAPVSLGALVSVGVSRALPAPGSTPGVVARTLGVIAVATLTVWVVDRWARKLLPLAALLRLSLIFPDHAPSRFRSALKSGSSRRLGRMVDETRANGLADDPGDAARQVVQLIGALGDHDRRTRGHSERVRLYADLVGEELKLTKEEKQKLQWGALLHDLGKLMVPGEILNKAGKPTDEEWAVLQGHPAAGMRLIEPLRVFLGEWVDAIGGHHEKWNGTGYPAKLRGDQIPRAAAIVAVADSFEVMTAARSYKKPMPLTEARAELTRCAGEHFSPEIVRAFLSISLGQLRLAAGPLAAIAHLPFLGGALQLPATAAAAIPTLTSGVAAVPIAAALMASTFGVTTPPSASGDTKTQNAAAVAGVDTRRAAGIDSTIPTGTGSADNGATSDGTTSSGGSSSGASGDGTTATLTDADRAAGSTTTTTVGATGDPTATTAPTTTDAKRTTDRVLETPTTMTTTSSPPTATTMPAPVTTMPVATTTTPIVNTLTLMVSQSSSHSSPQALAGSSFTIGSSAYIYAVTTHTDVSFTYPGGSSSRTSPFDMMMSGSNVTRFMMPLLPGTYSVSAHATGQGSSNDTSASFTVSLF